MVLHAATETYWRDEKLKRRRFIRIAAGGAGAAAGLGSTTSVNARVQPDKEYFRKMENFDAHHATDIFAKPDEMVLLDSSVARFARVQKTVGHGNFHTLGFDGAVKFAKRFSSVEAFTRAEIEFIEKLFYADARDYGFYGDKVLLHLTDEVRERHTVKLSNTGQRLFKGEALERYREVRRAVGGDVVLTSGVRGVVKQIFLFLSKAQRSDGNLSLASRSLAPPGYSFHGIGDFDVGKRGLGAANFTAKFAETDVYRKLVDSGFVEMRYPKDNLLGVRYEPWHIKLA